MTSNPITCKHLLNHILGSMTHNPLVIRHDLYSWKLFQGNFSICTPNMPNCTIFVIFQGSTLLNTHSKCAAVIPFFVLTQTYFIINWIQWSKVLVILQNSPNCMIWQFFGGRGGGEDALNSLTKPIVAKLLFLFLYLYNNIICEIFSNVFFVIMLVCLRIGAYVHTGQKSQWVSDKSCIYPWLKSHLMFLSNKQIHI